MYSYIAKIFTSDAPKTDFRWRPKRAAHGCGVCSNILCCKHAKLYAVPENTDAIMRQSNGGEEVEGGETAAVAAQAPSNHAAPIDDILHDRACAVPDKSNPTSTNTCSRGLSLTSDSMPHNAIQSGNTSISQGSAPTKLVANSATAGQARSRASFEDWLAPSISETRTTETSGPATGATDVSTPHVGPTHQPPVATGPSTAKPRSEPSSTCTPVSASSLSRSRLQRPATTAASHQGPSTGGRLLVKPAVAPSAESERSQNPDTSGSGAAPAKRKTGSATRDPDVSKQLRTAAIPEARPPAVNLETAADITCSKQRGPASTTIGVDFSTNPVSRVLQDSTNKPSAAFHQRGTTGAPDKTLATKDLTTGSHKTASQPSNTLQLDDSSVTMHEGARQLGL